MKLQGKIALVTGAGRGIGRAVAAKLAAEGASLVLNDMDKDVCEEAVNEINALGGSAVSCWGNVTAPDFAERFVKAAMDNYQGLDIIVNNAGYTWDSVIQKMSDEQWYAIMDCHLTAPFRILRAAQPIIRMLSKADEQAGVPVHRKVVNISSISGLGGNAGQVNYAVAKAGITGMTKTLAKEWGRMRVNVNTVAFGLIRTRMTEVASNEEVYADIDGRKIRIGVNPELLEVLESQIPLGRAGTPEDAAGAVYLFCIPEADYISGQTVTCGGGFAVG